MKTANILTLSILLISSSNYILGNQESELLNNNQSQTCQDSPINSNIEANTNKNANSNMTKSIEDDTECDIDELDALVNQAEESGIKVEPLEEPTALMTIARKIGVILFLNPYVFFVSNYRITKNFIAKYSYATWEAIVGKKPEKITPSPETK